MNRVAILIAGIFLVAASARAEDPGTKFDPEADPIKVRIESSGDPNIPPSPSGGKKALVKITDPANRCQGDLSQSIVQGLSGKGYQTTAGADPDYIISGSIIFHGEAAPEYVQAAYRSRYGTRLVEGEKKRDVIASGIGFLVNKVRAKSYVMILDLKVESSRKAGRGLAFNTHKARIVAGVEGSYRSADEILPAMEQALIKYVVGIF